MAIWAGGAKDQGGLYSPLIGRDKLIQEVLPFVRPQQIIILEAPAGAGKTSFLHLLSQSLNQVHWVSPKELEKVMEQNAHAQPFGQEERFLHKFSQNILIFDDIDKYLRAEAFQSFLHTLFHKEKTIFLATRTPLERYLYLQRLETEGKIHKINTQKLLFTREETEEYLAKRKIKTDIQQIFKYTQGWPGILNIVAEKIKRGYALKEALKESYFYLDQEIWQKLSKEEQRSLLLANIFQPLKTAYVESIFQGEWFLFRQYFLPNKKKNWRPLGPLHLFLEHKQGALSKDQRRDLFLKGYYLAKRERDWPKAIELLFKAQRQEKAWEIFREIYPGWRGEFKYHLIGKVLDQFSEDFTQRHPEVLLYKGDVLFFSGKIRQAIPVLEQGLEICPKTNVYWEGNIYLIEAHILLGNYQEALNIALKLQKQTKAFTKKRLQIQVYLAIIYSQLNLKDEAQRIWKKISAIARSKFLPITPYERYYLLAPKAIFYHLDQSDFHEAEAILLQASKVFARKDPQNRLAWVYLFLGVLKREKFSFQEAAEYFLKAQTLAYQRNMSFRAQVAGFSALQAAELGQKEAKNLLKKLDRFRKLDDTFWGEVLYKITKSILDPSKAKRELQEAFLLAQENHLTYLKALVAFTAFQRREMSNIPDNLIRNWLIEAYKDAEYLGIRHRAIRAILYIWHLNPKILSTHFNFKNIKQFLELLDREDLTYLFKRDKHIQKFNLAYWAAKKEIFFEPQIDLLGRETEGLNLLKEKFPKLPLKLKEKAALIFAQRKYRPALICLREAKKQDKRSKTIRHSLKILLALPPEPLRISFLGGFNLHIGQRHIREWPRQKAADIFKFLVLNRKKKVPIETLIETFWPKSDAKKGRSNVWQAISTIKEILEPESPPKERCRYISAKNESYQLLCPPNSYVDIETFEDKIKETKSLLKEGSINKALICAQEALEIYKGDFLPEDIYQEWTQSFRTYYQNLYQEILEIMGDIQWQKGLDYELKETALKLLQIDHLSEKAYEWLILISIKKGNLADAKRIYKKFKETLKKEMDLEPSPKLQALLDFSSPRKDWHQHLKGWYQEPISSQEAKGYPLDLQGRK